MTQQVMKTVTAAKTITEGQRTDIATLVRAGWNIVDATAEVVRKKRRVTCIPPEMRKAEQ